MRKLSLLFVLAASFVAAQQMADPNFVATIERPAFTTRHPRVVIDEAHENFHTMSGRYEPLADLLRADGYDVRPGTARFDKRSLRGIDLLVISNALGPDAGETTSGPAFTEAECDAVRDWVRAGGSLLLVADHAPFGAAAENLARRFGVDMGKGYVADSQHSAGQASLLVFSRENGLLGEHPLLQGRDGSERVQRVLTFTGQSLGVPKGATALLRLSPSAYEAADREALMNAVSSLQAGSKPSGARAVGGRAQGLAMNVGRGRVVMLGEAAMLSAQVIKMGDQEMKMGMNVAGSDDRQFALNLFRWLSGALK